MKTAIDKEIQSFLEYLSLELNYSKKTVSTYELALKEYTKFLSLYHYSLKEIDLEKANQYKAYLIRNKKENKTSSLYLTAVRMFTNFLVEIFYVPSNPYLNIKNPKVEKKLPNFLNPSEEEKIFKKEDFTNDLDIRNQAMIEFLYATGLRVSELVSVTLSLLNQTEKNLKIMGKGSKERIVFYSAMNQDLWKLYIEQARPHILENSQSEYLFTSKSGKMLSTRTVEKIVKEYSLKRDIKSKVTPHTFRHTYATDLLNNGADIRSVGELLGHESLSTTQIYTHVTSERLKKVYMKTHPKEKEKNHL